MHHHGVASKIDRAAQTMTTFALIERAYVELHRIRRFTRHLDVGIDAPKG